MEGLTSQIQSYKPVGETHLIEQKLRHSLLVNLNDITLKYLFSAVSLIGVQPYSHDLGIRPRGIFPAIDQGEPILDRMVEEP
jgi:hypothetical protein